MLKLDMKTGALDYFCFSSKKSASLNSLVLTDQKLSAEKLEQISDFPTLDYSSEYAMPTLFLHYFQDQYRVVNDQECFVFSKARLWEDIPMSFLPSHVMDLTCGKIEELMWAVKEFDEKNKEIHNEKLNLLREYLDKYNKVVYCSKYWQVIKNRLYQKTRA